MLIRDREEAIRKHREMWNWIADRIMERKRSVIIDELKQEYVVQHNEDILYSCYLCDYCIGMLDDEECEERCKHCPLDWESSGDEYGLYQCITNYEDNYIGLYDNVRRTKDWKNQYLYCRKIANLEEV